MPRSIDLTGSTFGHLIIMARAANNVQGSAQSLVRCVCGVEKIIANGNLRSGGTVSCGCKKIAHLADMNTTHGCAKKHDRRPEYGIWSGIISRCENKNLERYPDYGGRGISICEKWRNSFAAFLADVGDRPSPDHSIDRYPNNDGNYEPGNVRWATREQQAQNKRKAA
jgi:hypothetical protein